MEDNGRDQKKVVQTQNSSTDPIVFLKGLGLKEVSDKTFIKKKNLKALLEKDFANLDKTKAFGFIQILEREFNINLKGLRDDFSSYHQEAQLRKTKPIPTVETAQETVAPVVEKESKISETAGAFVKDKMEQVEGSNKSFLMPLLMGVGLLSAGWLLYSLTGEENTNEVVQAQVQEDRPLVEAQVEQVQESLLAMDGESEKSPSDTDTEDLDKAVKEMFQAKDSPEVEDSSTVAQPSPARQTPVQEEQNNKEEPTVIVDAYMQNKSNTSIEQTAKTDKSPSAIEVPQEERMPLLEDTPKEKTTASTKSASTNQNAQQVSHKAQNPKNDKTSSKSQKATSSVGLVISPMRKSWIQVVDLDTNKKKEYLIRKPLKLSSSKKLLIMVGDKDFGIKNNQKAFHFKSQKAVYFLNQNGKLQELSKEEYEQHLGDVH